MCDRLDVIRVAASWVLANVVELKTWRDWSKEKLKTCDVCILVFSVSNVELSVTMFSIPLAGPEQAAVCLWPYSLEPSLKVFIIQFIH